MCQPTKAPDLTKTIGEFRARNRAQGHHPSWAHSRVRQIGRALHKNLLKGSCAICGYEKHVELAHIRPVTDFPDEALLSEVNHPSNVVQLCPNCHWEFDKGLLTLETLRPSGS